jgi:hypothetical protein
MLCSSQQMAACWQLQSGVHAQLLSGEQVRAVCLHACSFEKQLRMPAAERGDSQ